MLKKSASPNTLKASKNDKSATNNKNSITNTSRSSSAIATRNSANQALGTTNAHPTQPPRTNTIVSRTTSPNATNHNNSKKEYNNIVAYEKILTHTKKIRSIDPTFYQHWLCCLGNDYLVTASQNASQDYTDDAIATFSLVWRDTKTQTASLEASLIQASTTAQQDSIELVEIKFSTAQRLHALLQENLRNLEKSIMGIVNALQVKRKAIPELSTDRRQNIHNEVFLTDILKAFNEFSDIDTFHPLVTSCLSRTLSNYFFRYLQNHHSKYQNATIQQENAPLKNLLQDFNDLQALKKPSEIKPPISEPFTPLYKVTTAKQNSQVFETKNPYDSIENRKISKD